jgi:DNA-binding MarR family transcriptional regulator
MARKTNSIDILLGHINSLLTSKYDLALSNMLGITYSQYKILEQFTSNSVVRQKTIAKSLNQTEASISRQLSIMNASGLITKTYDPGNRKSIIITLTKKGKTIKINSKDIISRENFNLISKINKKEQKILVKNLQDIHDHLSITL